VLARTGTDVTEDLSRVLGTAKEDRLLAERSTECEGIESQGLTAGLKDPCLGGLSEAKSRDRELGYLEEANVIRNGANDDDGLAFAVLSVADDARERDGRAVNARHEETLENHLVEVGVCTASKETIELHQQTEIDIV